MYLFAISLFGICLSKSYGQGALNKTQKNNQHPVHHDAYPYLIYLPERYSSGNEKWPLLLFLHGMGERGEKLDSIKKHGPPKLIEEGKLYPFIVISPQCPDTEWWQADKLNDFLLDLIHEYRIDVDRIYLTGLSMGGFGSWEFATSYPDFFAAVAPICGGGDPEKVCNMKNVPTWVFHGANDPVVPLERSREMVEALEACNDHVKFTVYPEAGHDSWTQTYTDPSLYSWFLNQKK